MFHYVCHGTCYKLIYTDIFILCVDGSFIVINILYTVKVCSLYLESIKVIIVFTFYIN